MPVSKKAATEEYNRLGCTACPLNNVDMMSPKMGATLAPKTEVLFLGEAPGRYDDEESGKPFSGPAGNLVHNCLPRGWQTICSFDNICNCRPEGNRTPVWQEVECCRPRRQSVIERTKPKLIIGLGKVPLSFMLGSTDIRNLRGRFFPVKVGNHECYFMSTLDPKDIIEKAYNKKEPLRSRFGHAFKKDIENAFEMREQWLDTLGIEEPEAVKLGVSIHTGEVPHRILQLLGQATSAPIKAVDIETSCLRPYQERAKILTIAISYDDVNFSFAWDHPQSQLDENSKTYIWHALAHLLRDDTIKVAHNAPFEIEWFIKEFGREVVNHTAWHCTMMQAHFLDERKGGNRDDDNTGANRYLALDFLIHLHFGRRYKSLFQLNKKDMASADLTETLIYNGVDTKYTLRLYHKQKQLLKERGLWKAYLEAAPRQPTVALMQHIGMPVDQDEVKRLQEKLGPEILATEREIEKLEVVQQFKRDHEGEFNPLSGPNTLKIFKEYLKREEVHVQSGGKNSSIGRYSVDRNVLDRIDHPLAKMIVKLRHDTKMKSTYIDGLCLGEGKLIYLDGKIHTSFHTTGTETGRLSSSNPNAQNYPKKSDAYVRRTIVAPPGHLIVAVDYSQLEGCTLAMCSKDPYYVQALKEDYDTHMVWAKRLAELVPDCTRQVDGKFRSMVKNKLVFPSFFGATLDSVIGYLSEGCGRPMPTDKIETLLEEFWETFAGVKRWQNRLMKSFYDKGYVETLSGRRRNYPLSRNEAINHPVQGTAAELVLDAMVRLSYLAKETGNWHVHPILNIHDDLTFCVSDNEPDFDKSVADIVREMLTFDFPWINVPLACDVSVGHNWCDLKPLGKFWSTEL